MPRLARSLLAQAHDEHHFLPLLLRAVRDLSSARLELKWLGEHVYRDAESNGLKDRDATRRLDRLVRQRARGRPLQYLLGSEFFGDLELHCRPGVLIPRPETAASVLFALKRLPQLGCSLPTKPRILDLCTGTGCIPLLTATAYPYKETSSDSTKILAVDISTKAIALTRYNRVKVLNELNLTDIGQGETSILVQESLKALEFVKADVLSAGKACLSGPSDAAPSLDEILEQRSDPHFDILISNPPYISPEAFETQTTRSVRNFEPKLALVPTSTAGTDAGLQGDVFYPRLLKIAQQVKAKILLFEVSDMAQACRVADLALESHWPRVEIWRDEPDSEACEVQDSHVVVRGRGDGRSVFCYNPETARAVPGYKGIR